MVSRLLIFAQIATFYLLLTLFLIEAGKKSSEYSIKTIEMENGDIYDCVDFYKQPAFNHPLLENHSFYPEMRPSSRPKNMGGANRSTPRNGESITLGIKFKNGSCPIGTVPIRRMNNNDDHLFQTNLLRQRYANLGINPNGDQSNGNVYFAIAQSKSDPTKKYYGLGANISVYNPHTLPSQYSSAEIIIKGGPTDAIIAGWTVNPMVYKDNQTRFFIYAVIRHTPDFPITPISTVGGPTYIYQVFIYQDEMNGNWWLEVTENNIILGFWPQKIFKGLYSSASYVACGGEAYGPSNLPRPEMGNGYFPFSELPKYNAYCQNIVVVDEEHKVVYADDTERFSSDNRNYAVFQVEDRTVIFGGPKDYEL